MFVVSQAIPTVPWEGLQTLLLQNCVQTLNKVITWNSVTLHMSPRASVNITLYQQYTMPFSSRGFWRWGSWLQWQDCKKETAYIRCPTQLGIPEAFQKSIS